MKTVASPCFATPLTVLINIFDYVEGIILLLSVTVWVFIVDCLLWNTKDTLHVKILSYFSPSRKNIMSQLFLVMVIRFVRLLVVGIVRLFVVILPRQKIHSRDGVRVAIHHRIPVQENRYQSFNCFQRRDLHFGFLLEGQRLSAVNSAVVADHAGETGFADFVELLCENKRKFVNWIWIK